MTQNESIAQDRSSEELIVNVIDISDNEQTSSYLTSALLRYILLHMRPTEESKNNLFNRLKSLTSQKSDYAQYVAGKFAEEYQSEKAIWWYTEDSFLYNALNKALRNQDVDFLYDIRRFLVDLYQQIQQNHLNFDFKKTLYRGIKLSDHEAEKMTMNQGKLIHFDQFLSTSTDEQIAKGFIGDRKPGHKPILFHIDISSAASEIDQKEEPIACIQEFSQRPSEKEVLISPSSVFRLLRIDELLDKDTKIKVWHIFLELTTARDRELSATYRQLKKEIEIDEKYPTDEIQLAKLLRRLDKSQLAINYYLLALEVLNKAYKTHNLQGETCYEQYQTVIFTDLALTYGSEKNYDRALHYIDKAKESAEKLSIRPYDRPFRAIMNAKRLIYTQRHCENYANTEYVDDDDLSNALKCIIKIREMLKTSGTENTFEHATVLNNIGVFNIYRQRFNQALEFFDQALKIQRQILPLYHIDLAKSYNNMAYAYVALGDSKKAENCSKEAQKIKTKILPENHKSICSTQKIAGKAQFLSGKYVEAYSTLEQAAEIFRGKNISRADIRLSEVETLLDLVYEEMKKTS